MFFLRPPHGSLPVGAVTLVAPVRPALSVGTATLATDNSPALVLDEVAFTAYYPADPSSNSRKGLDWLCRPVSASLRGFSRFTGVPSWLLWPLIRFFGAVLKIPVYPNAPLLHPGDTRKQWPLVIFSHGLCGTRTAYSQLCSEIAASGRVVLAVEHRDGTAPACTLRPGRPDERTVLYYRDADIVLPPDATPAPRILPLRADQLEFRQHEVYRIYAAFRDLVRDGTTLAAVDGTPVDFASWAPPARPALVNCDDVALIGHSFGGCTALSLVSTPPPSSFPPIPISKVLLYDPWLEPLPLPGPTPIMTSISERTLADADDKREAHREELLVINSQVFSLWKDHFTRLAGVVDAWEPQGRRLLTLVGSQHASFSDFPLLPLVRTRAASALRDRAAELTLSFLDGALEAVLNKVPIRKMEVKIIGTHKDGRPKRTLIGEVGDVVVH
ncbi:platelet-activating factor acetylhydrolase, isoform II-domain-containing protein [Mycena galericulata]|nr:platelet-activating factor acetylhydrolase, isoform II-domain-containing protein [Mycena galericulata]